MRDIDGGQVTWDTANVGDVDLGVVKGREVAHYEEDVEVSLDTHLAEASEHMKYIYILSVAY